MAYVFKLNLSYLLLMIEMHMTSDFEFTNCSDLQAQYRRHFTLFPKSSEKARLLPLTSC